MLKLTYVRRYFATNAVSAFSKIRLAPSSKNTTNISKVKHKPTSTTITIATTTSVARRLGGKVLHLYSMLVVARYLYTCMALCITQAVGNFKVGLITGTASTFSYEVVYKIGQMMPDLNLLSGLTVD